MKTLLMILSLVFSVETFAAAATTLNCKGDDGSILTHNGTGTLKIKTDKGFKSLSAEVDDGFAIIEKNQVSIKFIGAQKVLNFEQEHSCNLDYTATEFKQKAKVTMTDKTTKTVTFVCKETLKVAGSAYSDCQEH